MNTTAKGDVFEKNSLKIIYNAIQEKRIGLIADYVKVFEKQPYYSKDREGDIIFDLSIELWPPAAPNYTLLYLIECKNYNSSVPVSDVEEFYAKICQVSGVNVKGVFITNRGFQDGAYKFAKSKGMMLIIGEFEENYEITLYKSNRTDLPITNLIESAVNNENSELEKLIDDTIKQAINLSVSSNANGDFNIEFLSKADIELKANDILNAISPRILVNGDKLFKSAIADYTLKNYGVKIGVLYNEEKILGKCDFRSKQILISSKILDSPRHYFVLAHEFGHLVLHEGLKIGQEAYNNFEDSAYNITTGKHELKNAKNWVEWQANYFATCLLLPSQVLMGYLKLYSGSYAPLVLNDQRSNITLFNEVTKKLADRFSVTKTTIIMRLKELHKIENKSHLKTIGQIIEENVDELFL